MRIVQTLIAPIAAPVRKDILKKGESCQGKIRLDLSSNKLVKIFFSIQLPFANLLCSQCNDDSHVCYSNANCTNTNGSHNCICKKRYIINGQSCQCRLKQRYLMSSKAAFHNKYCLRIWGYDREVAWWFLRPDLVFLLGFEFHHMHTFTFFDVLEYNTRGYAVLPM